jgi:hypothetical protein
MHDYAGSTVTFHVSPWVVLMIGFVCVVGFAFMRYSRK